MPANAKKGFSWGTEKKAKEIKSEAPAPGQYEYKSLIVEGPQYTIKQKYKEKIEPTPGPGLYETIIKEEKGFTIGQKLPEKGFEDLPAPGQYEIKSRINEGPQYSIYERREGKVEQTPGPGEYELREEGAHGFTIGERLKE